MQNTIYKKLDSIKLILFIYLFFISFGSKAQFPFSESFKNSTASNIQFGGSPTAFLTAGAGLKDGFNDPVNDGYLRLTNKATEQSGMIWSDLYAFPSAYGMTISFEYYTHGGNGADGIAFVLFDATTPVVTSGAYGGSLGYAQKIGVNGFTGGYLGIGIDEYGGFPQSSEGRNEGLSSRLTNNISLRGQGSGITGYPYLTSKQTTSLTDPFNIEGKDRTATDNTKNGFRKIEINLKPRSGGGFYIDVYIVHGSTKSLIIDNYAYTTVAPPNLKFAITSSTGGQYNFHEIRNLELSVNLSTLITPVATPVSFSGCAGLPAVTSYDINSKNNGKVNTLGTINRATVDLDQDKPGIQSTKIVAGKGTFSYDAVTGKVTFTPLDNTIEGVVAINYTFNDSYGKLSNTSTITYNTVTPDIAASNCIPVLKTDVKALQSSVYNILNEIISYEIKISNSGSGMANDVKLDFILPKGFSFVSAAATYSNDATGPSGIITQTANASNPMIGNFNIPPNGTATILLKGKITGTTILGIQNVDAQATYSDPTKSTRSITPFINYFAAHNTYSTGENVPGSNFAGDYTTADSFTLLPEREPIITTGVTVCKGESGVLTATNSTLGVKKFDGYWNEATDPQALIPYSTFKEPMKNSTTCKFANSTTGNYTATTFSVTIAGIYDLKMTNPTDKDGMAYIYYGDFTPGTCAGEGTWVIGDDDYEGTEAPPRLIVHLDPGITYTLISTRWSASGDARFVGDYEWTITPPEGGQFLLNTLNYWYTSRTGGIPIGWGNSFDPVGVEGSGLADTETAGTTTYYVSDGTSDAARIPVDFVIKEDATCLACTSKPSPNTTTETINWDENYTWPANGVTYTSSQSGLTIEKDNCTANEVLNLTVNPKVEGVNICRGGSGELTVTESSQSVTQFSGHWNATTDPRAFFPNIKPDRTICSFINYGKGNYTATTFRVSQSGIYNLKMADQELDGVAYIYSGNFTPGTCSGEGNYIIGDRNYDGPGTNPRLITHLDAGVTYTLVSTMYPPNYDGSTDFYGDYTWTVTPPPGGQFIIDTLNYWYTTSTGGNPIGWGNSFNPVGVAGSGLPDTNTAGTTTYYVSNGMENSTRTPVDFTIKDATVTEASSEQTVCVNNKITDITHTTTLVTSIGEAIKLPAGVTASFEDNLITISGTPTVSGTFNYEIPLTGVCGDIVASGTINVTEVTATIAGTTQVCKDATISEIIFTGGNGTVPYTFSYKLNGGIVQTVSSTGVLNTAKVATPTNVEGIFTYELVSVKDSSNTNCERTQNGTAIITVNPTATVNKPSNQTKTNGENTSTVTFTGAVAGTTYAWTNDNPSIGLAASGTGDVISFTAINTGNIPVVATISVTPAANGCTGLAQNFTITVNPTASVGTLVDQVWCNGDTTTKAVFASNVTGTTFAWTNDKTNIGLGASGSGDIPVFNAVNSGTTAIIATISVTPTANGVVGESETFKITVNPTATVDTVTPQTICNAETTTAVAFTNAVAGTTYTWINDTPAIGLAASGTGDIAAFTAANTTPEQLKATITVTPTANGCEGTQASFNITVNPTATVNKPSNQTKTNGENTSAVTFTGAVAGTTYAWTNDNPSIGLAASGTGDVISFTAINTGNIPVVATISVTPAANGCTGLAQNFTITVNPTASVGTLVDQVWCNGDTTTKAVFASNVTGTTFAWTNDKTNIGLEASGSGDIPVFTAVNSGTTAIIATISVTPTANGVVGESETFKITVNPTATVDTVTPQTICNAETTTAVAFTNAVAGTTYTWINDTPAIGLAASGTGDIAAFTAANTTPEQLKATITVTPTANGCEGTQASFNITVNPTATVNKPSNQTKTNGENTSTVTFTGAVAGTTYAWTNDNPSIGLAASGTGDVISFTAINTGNIPVVATISVTPAANGCTGLAQNFTITVNPTASVGTLVDQVWCNGDTTTKAVFASNVTGTTFAWTNDKTNIGLGASGSGDIPVFNAVNSGTTAIIATISVTPTANGVVGESETFKITVNPTATVDTVTPQTICNAETTTAVAFTNAVAGTTYTWINDTPAIGLAASGTGDIAAFTAANTTPEQLKATITVTPTANGCEGTQASFNITVNPTATVNKPSNQTKTNGENTSAVTFTGAVAGTTYAWTNDNPSIGLAASGTGDVISFTAINTGNIPVVATISVTPAANGCTGLAQNFTITVNPTASVGTLVDQVWCNGDTTTKAVFASNVTGTTFAWTNDKTNIGLGASGSGDIPVFTAVNSGTTAIIATISVTPTANGVVGESETFKITVNPTATVDTVTPQTICNAETTTAVAFTNAVAGTTYTWINDTPAIGLAASGTGEIAAFTAANTTPEQLKATITVTPTANGCQGTPMNFNIIVNPTATVDNVALQTICNGETTKAVAFNNAVAGTSYTWTNDNASIGLAAFGTGDITAFTATNTTSAPITANITVTPTANNCVGTASSFKITINPTATVNTVTPQTICNGETTTVIVFANAVAGTTYTWTNDTPAIGLQASGTGNIAAFKATNTTSVPVTATITVTPTANNCVGTASSFKITVNPTATVNKLIPKTICNGETTTAVAFANAAAGTTYTWTNDNASIGLAAFGTGDITAFTATNTTSAPITANITVTPTANNCVGTASSFKITINPTATVNTVTPQTICNGETTTVIVFANAVAGTTYTWTNDTPAIGLQASGTGNIAAFKATNTTSVPVTATITVTPTANNCVGTASSFKITVNPTATVNKLIPQTICNGETTTAVAFANAVAGTTYTWTNDNASIGLAASGTGDITAFTATNTTSAPITANITVTPTANNCVGTASSFKITINPTATVNTVTPQTICNGETTTAIVFANAVAGTTYTWTNDTPAIGLQASGTGNIAAFKATNTTSVPVTATITVTPTANNCVGTASSFKITVNPTATVNKLIPQTICNGETTTAVAFANAVAGTTYTWTNDNASIRLAAFGTGDITAFTATNTTSAPITANITVTPTANNCVGTASSFKITINPTATVNTVTPQTICNGETTTAIVFANAVAGTTYTWTNDTPAIGLQASGTGNIAAFKATNTTSVPVTATITVTPTANNCVGTASSFKITVNPTATVNKLIPQTICNGETTTAVAFANAAAGTTYTWTNDNASIGLAASGTGDITAFTATNTTSAPITANITVTPTANNCVGTASSFKITVNPTATVNTVTPQTICNGETTTAIVFANAVAGTTYTWTNDTPAIGLQASGTGNIAAFKATNTTSAAVTATIKVTPTANGCTGTAQTFTITVISKIIPALIEDSLLPEICAGDKNGAFSIEVSGGKAPFSYSLDKKTGTFSQGTFEQKVFDFENLSAGKHIFYINNALGCSAQLEIIIPSGIVINPVAEINYSCVNNTAENSVVINIDSSIKNRADVDYSLDGGTYQPENSFKNITAGTHTITARHTNGCEKTTSPFIIEDVQPLTLTLADGELNEIVATATGGSGTYQYTFDGESNNKFNKLIIYKSGTYTVTVTDSNGCSASASRYFEYIDVCIPNHFTPNGDGINDEWGPGCSVNYKNLTFSIFDRYGRIIGNYKYGQKWDGKYNGTELASGDYWYVFKLNDNKDNREFVGHFTLYR